MSKSDPKTPLPKTPLLEIVSATQIFGGGPFQKRVVALADFSLIMPGDKPKIVALAGESGSGKSTAARVALGFQRLTSGRMLYRGAEVAKMSRPERSAFRREVQAILQDPYEAYNPFYRIDRIFHSVIRAFNLAPDEDAAMTLIREALAMVGLREEETLGKYPHQLSGGQRQRLMIARAFLMKPRLIIADEPVSMIDASRRAQIIEIIQNLRSEFGISFLYITHDLSTAYSSCDDIIILHNGRIVEQGDARQVIDHPQADYTRLLVGSVPAPDPDIRWAEEG